MHFRFETAGLNSEAIKQFLLSDNVGPNLLNVAFKFGLFSKHESFREENECRLGCVVRARIKHARKPNIKVETRENAALKVPFIALFKGEEALPIMRVIVGPSPDGQRTRSSIESFRDLHGYNFPVTVSETPYRG